MPQKLFSDQKKNEKKSMIKKQKITNLNKSFMADRPPDQVSCTFLYFGLTFSTLHHIIKEVYLNSFTFFSNFKYNLF